MRWWDGKADLFFYYLIFISHKPSLIYHHLLSHNWNNKQEDKKIIFENVKLLVDLLTIIKFYLLCLFFGEWDEMIGWLISSLISLFLINNIISFLYFHNFFFTHRAIISSLSINSINILPSHLLSISLKNHNQQNDDNLQSHLNQEEEENKMIMILPCHHLLPPSINHNFINSFSSLPNNQGLR